MYHWIRGLGFPESFEEYEDAIKDMRYGNRNEAVFSDISVFTNTGHRNANIEYHFKDAYPFMVSAPRLSTTNPDQPTVTASVQFTYELFDVKPVKIG
jgi:hypothetical protein